MAPVTRHAISLMVVGGALTVMFFIGIREPLAAATENDARQDAAISSNKQHIDKTDQALADVARTQAVQAATIANMLGTQQDTKTALDNINRKLDHLMERGR